MKKILPASLVLAAVFYYAISQAQTQPQVQIPAPPDHRISTAENKTPLDERFSDVHE